MSDMNELAAQLEALRSENAALKEKQVRKISYKVSEKGAVSVYGLGRWPVTLYANQMKSLLERREGILAFIEDNIDSLSIK
jgi:hypothetical protein